VQAKIFELCGRLSARYVAVKLETASQAYAERGSGPLACMDHQELVQWLWQAALVLLANSVGAFRSMLLSLQDRDEGNTSFQVRDSCIPLIQFLG
jgi:hypothetical protein